VPGALRGDHSLCQRLCADVEHARRNQFSQLTHLRIARYYRGTDEGLLRSLWPRIAAGIGGYPILASATLPQAACALENHQPPAHCRRSLGPSVASIILNGASRRSCRSRTASEELCYGSQAISSRTGLASSAALALPGSLPHCPAPTAPKNVPDPLAGTTVSGALPWWKRPSPWPGTR